MYTPVSVVRRWPRRSRFTSVVAASLLASIFAFGAAGLQPAQTNAVTAPWESLEAWYLKLVNCTRTGGWVAKNGTCSGYGSGRYSKYVAPLKLSAGISNVSRAWSKNLATTNRCVHGDPGARLRAAGYRGYSWGENIGCGMGTTDVKASILMSHRAMQAERSTNGGHWKNMKNPRFKLAGVGIWRYGTRVRVTTDFYAP